MDFSKLPSSSAFVASLFILLVVLQVVDVHSTLTAPSHRAEANPVIVWIGMYTGISTALIVVKLFAVCVIAFLFRFWQNSKGTRNRQFAIVIAALNIEYLVIVTNNYRP